MPSDTHIAICKCLKRGYFTLQSGAVTDAYLDLRELFAHPKIMERIAAEIIQNVDDKIYDAVAGCPYGAIPYAVLVAKLTNKSLIMLRKESKKHGAESNNERRRVLLLEDVTTTGQSLARFSEVLTKQGCEVSMTYSIVNRSTTDNVPCLFAFRDITHPPADIRRALLRHPLAIKIWDRVQSHKTNVCLAADVSTTTELMRLLHQVEPYICALKLHSDLIADWTPEFGRELKAWCIARNLVILEDRKLADIGHIMIQQAKLLATHADCVTVHTISGSECLQTLSREVPLVVVESMSSNPIAMARSIEMSAPIVGIVSQTRGPLNCLTFTPGVALNAGSDGLGQKYRDVASVDADVIIVGRGITRAPNVVQAALNFRGKL